MGITKSWHQISIYGLILVFFANACATVAPYPAPEELSFAREMEWADEARSPAGQTGTAPLEVQASRQLAALLTHLEAASGKGEKLPGAEYLWQATRAMAAGKPADARLLASKFLLTNSNDPYVKFATSSGQQLPHWVKEKLDGFNVTYSGTQMSAYARSFVLQSLKHANSVFTAMDPRAKNAKGKTGGVMAQLKFNLSRELGGREARFLDAQVELSNHFVRLLKVIRDGGPRTAMNLINQYNIFALEMESLEDSLKAGQATFPDHVMIIGDMVEYFERTGTFGSRKVLEKFPGNTSLASLIDGIEKSRARLGERELGEGLDRAYLAWGAETGEAFMALATIVGCMFGADEVGVGEVISAASFKTITTLVSGAYGAEMAYAAIDDSNQLGVKSTDLAADLDFSLNVLGAIGIGSRLLPLKMIVKGLSATAKGRALIPRVQKIFLAGTGAFAVSQGGMAIYQAATAKTYEDWVHAVETAAFAVVGFKGLHDSLTLARQQDTVIGQLALLYDEAPVTSGESGKTAGSTTQQLMDTSKEFAAFLALATQSQTAAKAAEFAQLFESQGKTLDKEIQELQKQLAEANTPEKTGRQILLRQKIEKRQAMKQLAARSRHEAALQALMLRAGIAQGMEDADRLINEAGSFQAISDVERGRAKNFSRRGEKYKAQATAAFKRAEAADAQAVNLHTRAHAIVNDILRGLEKNGQAKSVLYFTIQATLKGRAEHVQALNHRLQALKDHIASLETWTPGNAKASDRHGDMAAVPDRTPEIPPFIDPSEGLTRHGIVFGPNHRFQAAFNPAAWVAKDPKDGVEKVFMVVRGEEELKGQKWGRKSLPYLAVSTDGLKFELVQEDPIFLPTDPWDEVGGIEDCRYQDLRLQPYVDKDGKSWDGALYYTGYDGTTARVAVVLFNHDNPSEFKKAGLLFRDEDVKKNPLNPGNPGWVKSPAAVQFRDRKTGKIRNVIYAGEGNIHHGGIMAMEADSPLGWVWPLDRGPSVVSRLGFYSQGLVEPAFAPIVTDLPEWMVQKTGHQEGIVLCLHGDAKPKGYQVGYVVFSLDDPTGKPIYEADGPFIWPQEDYEINGQVEKVVFASASVIFRGRRWIYYGGADRVIGAISAKVAKWHTSAARK